MRRLISSWMEYWQGLSAEKQGWLGASSFIILGVILTLIGFFLNVTTADWLGRLFIIFGICLAVFLSVINYRSKKE